MRKTSSYTSDMIIVTGEKNIILLIIANALLALALFVFLNFSPLVYLNFIGFFVLLVFTISISISIRLGVITYLLIKAWLDIFRNTYVFLQIQGLNISAYLTLLFIAFSTISILRNRIPSNKFSLFRPFLIFLAVLFLTQLFSINKLTSFDDWLRFLGLCNFYICVVIFFSSRKDTILLIRTIILSLIPPIVLAFLQFITKSGVYDGGFLRVYGTYIHPNMFAFYLITIMLFLVANIVSEKPFLKKLYTVPLLFILAFFLILTYTRAAWIGFAISLLFIGIIRVRKSPSFLIILIITLLLVSPALVSRFRELSGLYTEGYKMNSWSWRLLIWGKSLGMAKKNILCGSGLGYYVEGMGFYPHNDYLRMLIETGVLGLFTYIGLFFVFFKNAFLRYIKLSHPFIKQTSLTVLVITMAYGLISFSDNLSRSPSVLIYFLALVAISDNCYFNYKDEKPGC